MRLWCKLFHPNNKTWIHYIKEDTIKKYETHIAAEYDVYCPCCSNTETIERNFVYDNEYIKYSEALERCLKFKGD